MNDLEINVHENIKSQSVFGDPGDKGSGDDGVRKYAVSQLKKEGNSRTRKIIDSLNRKGKLGM